MHLELLENELNRLLKDKETIVKTIAQMELELENLKNKSFMLDGAIQTCSFFVESEKVDNKKADRLKKNKKPLANFEDGRISIILAETANKSFKSKKFELVKF